MQHHPDGVGRHVERVSDGRGLETVQIPHLHHAPGLALDLGQAFLHRCQSLGRLPGHLLLSNGHRAQDSVVKEYESFSGPPFVVSQNDISRNAQSPRREWPRTVVVVKLHHHRLGHLRDQIFAVLEIDHRPGDHRGHHRLGLRPEPGEQQHLSLMRIGLRRGRSRDGRGAIRHNGPFRRSSEKSLRPYIRRRGVVVLTPFRSRMAKRN